ncbi:MAG: agmatinase [Hyphomicrobiaceae bacterium]
MGKSRKDWRRIDYLPPDEAFLDPEREDRDRPEDARAVVIPFGLEASVSYGSGTAKGPAAILAASHQLELFDEELWREPYLDYGIATLAEPRIPKSIEKALDRLDEVVESVVEADRFPFVIGGEHSLTAGAIRPLVRRHPGLTVLQFDAHADLRDGYLGEHYSHASAMRRVLDHKGVSLVSVGIRAMSKPEADFLFANRRRIHMHFAHAQHLWDIEDIVAPLNGHPVYISFDIDGLDGSVMPATGTPTPGGLGYWQALAILKRACEVGNVVGADLVELAPMKGLHACDFLAAQLAYKMLSYALSGTGPRVSEEV